MSIEKQLADTVASLVLAQIKPHLNNNKILKESEVMEILGVSKKTMQNYRNDGLKAFQPTGSQYYYFMSDLEAFVRRNGRAL